jgi:hypothetical protein
MLSSPSLPLAGEGGAEWTMDRRDKVKKLAHSEQAPYPFLSLYFNTEWDDNQKRERIRLITKNQLK